MSSRASNFFRIVIAVGLTAYLLYRSDPGQVGEALRGVSWNWIGLAVLLVFADRALMAVRWMWLLGPVDRRLMPSRRALWRIFFVSTFMGSFLPGSVGADAVRTWQVTQRGVPGAQALASVLMDRVLGIASILVAATGSWIFFPQLLDQNNVRLAFFISFAACTVALAFVFSTQWDAFCRRWLLLRLPARLLPVTDRVLAALQAYQSHHGTTLVVLAASVNVQLLRILQAWCLGMSLGMTTPIASYFAFVPIILLVMLLPITISGLGVAQWAFIWLFVPTGAAEPVVFALSVLFLALGFLGNLPGALLFLTGKERRP